MILRFFKYMFILVFTLALLLCGGYVYARYVEPNMLTVNRQTISFDDLPSNLEGLRVGFFSDTHVSNSFPADTVLANVVKKLSDEKPDIIFFAGDLFNNMAGYSGDESEVIKLLSSLTAPYGKYAVYGNHDYQVKTYKKYQKIMKESGFVLLKDEILVRDDLQINVIGIDETLLGGGTVLYTNNVDNDNFNIVLSHEPDILKEAQRNIDLMLSGHTHGGQVNVPFYGPILLPRLGRTFVKGEYREIIGDGSEAVIFVTSGIGMSKLPLRFLQPPEIAVLTLTQK